MHRFFCPSLDPASDTSSINDPDEIHHIKDVLRLQTGSIIELINGRGDLASAQIRVIRPGRIEVKIEKRRHIPKRVPEITLACAIPKKSKFEAIIEKATELGVDTIIPLNTQRTEVELKGERADKKLLRYETVALNASKQSKRVWLPVVRPVTAFGQAVSELTESSVVLIPSLTGNTTPLLQTLSQIEKPRSIAVLIGPEGDFTPEEYALAHQKCLPVSLGDTILKVETAALCSLSCVSQFFYGKY